MESGVPPELIPRYYPALLFVDVSIGSMITGLLSSFVGVICLAAGSIGYLAGPLCMWKRLVMFAGTALMLHPSTLTDILGIVIIVVMVMIQKKAFPKVTAEKE